MTSSKSTKRALLTSVLALLMCVTMLVGATFAWFTDTASTGVNKIVSGNLKVDIIDANSDSHIQTLNFTKAEGAEDEALLWEPGCHYLTKGFRIANKGNLALKWKAQVNTGTTAANEGNFDLLDVIDFYLVKGTGESQTETPLNEFTGNLKKTETSDVYYIKGVMQTTAGNDYQGLTLDGITITVVATQDTVEHDSYDNQYDKDAEYAIPVATADELTAALANGQNVILTAPIKMPEVIEVKGDITIYGGENGKLLVPDNADRVINITENTEPLTLTLSNVDVVGPTSGTYTRGISVYGTQNVTIVVDNSSVSANYYALNIASANENVKVVVKNTTITGWCAFQTWSAGTKATFENCTLIGNNDKGYNADGWNNFATVVINENTTGVDLTFNNCRIEANQTTGNKQYLLSVRASDAKVTLNNCTFFANETEIADEDLGNYLNIYPVASDLVLTIDGQIIPIE